jgi:sugar-phosphatase
MAALLFDFDGVLVDSLRAYRKAWVAWATAYGVTPEEFPADIHGLRPRDVIARLRPAADLEAAVAAFDALFDGPAAAHARAMPGAVDLTEELAGRPWAIVSSTQRRHVLAMLAGAGLPEPPVLVCGDDLEHGKPDPQGFLFAAERLGAAPAGCIVIEDAPAGLEAASRAGMESVAVATTHEPAELAAAGRLFATLADAAGYLRARAAEDGPRPVR